MPNYNPQGIESLSAHYNATTLDLSLALRLLVDKDNSWERAISDPAPLVVTGMRGCGKTHLLKSLSWAARLEPRTSDQSETMEKMGERLHSESFVGLYQTCDILRNAPESPKNKLLLLGYSYEALRLLEVVGARNLGQLRHAELPRLVDVLSNNVAWFMRPKADDSIADIQEAVSQAIYRSPDSQTDCDRRAFEEFSLSLTPLLDLWNGKRIFFLLDDVSRHLSQEAVFPFLRQLLVQNEHYAFKVSAETLTVELLSPGGAPARGDRDFGRFDLGEVVLGKLAGSAGVAFVEDILDLRTKYAQGAYQASARDVLGRRSLHDIAQSIAASAKSRPSDIYWGMNALAGMCAGDIGSIIQLYAQIVKEANLGQNSTFPIDPTLQHKVAIRFADSRGNLLHQESDGPLMHRHAREFSKASHDFLLATAHCRRLQQATEIQLDLAGMSDEEEAATLKLVDRLVQKGVFVLAPSTHRLKSGSHTTTRSSDRKFQLRLMFTKSLGLSSFIPLGRRGRFELPYKDYGVLDWLRDPNASRLVPAGKQDESQETDDAESTLLEPISTASSVADEAPEQTQQLAMSFASDVQDMWTGNDAGFAPTVCADMVERWQECDWQATEYIGAFGFEDRSLGVWERLREANSKPNTAFMIAYPEPGLASEVSSLLESWGVPYESFAAPEDNGSYSAVVAKILGRLRGNQLVIDTTSLTKPFIYEFVRQSLGTSRRVFVLHACAETYDPPDEQLRQVLQDIEACNEPDVRSRLDEKIVGEKAPFTVETIADQPRDPGASTVLVTFVPLKHERVQEIVNRRSADMVVAIATTNSQGPAAVRSKIGRKLSEVFSAGSGGETHAVAALDVEASYRLLRELYRRFALVSGHNFELALTGSKMQTVAEAMLGWSLPPTGVYYSKPKTYSTAQFTHGTESIRLYSLRTP
jgi:hypothetical protein